MTLTALSLHEAVRCPTPRALVPCGRAERKASCMLRLLSLCHGQGLCGNRGLALRRSEGGQGTQTGVLAQLVTVPCKTRGRDPGVAPPQTRSPAPEGWASPRSTHNEGARQNQYGAKAPIAICAGDDERRRSASPSGARASSRRRRQTTTQAAKTRGTRHVVRGGRPPCSSGRAREERGAASDKRAAAYLVVLSSVRHDDSLRKRSLCAERLV